MMEQHSDPISLIDESGGSHAHATIIPTDDDQRAVLLSSKQDAICKHQAKKDLLVKLSQSRTTILELADFYDSINNSNIKDTLNRLLPERSGNTKKQDNNTASASLVGVFGPMCMLREFSVEQNKAKAGVSTNVVKNGTASRISPAVKRRDDVMGEVEELFRNTEMKARERYAKRLTHPQAYPLLQSHGRLEIWSFVLNWCRRIQQTRSALGVITSVSTIQRMLEK
jgi:hypothetical protein